MTYNVQDTDNVQDTGNKYRERFTLDMDERVMRQLRILAFRDGVTLRSIVAEALATYLKWMKKAEFQDQAIERLEQTKEELREADLLLKSIVRAQERAKRRKKRPKKTEHELAHPGIMSPTAVKARDTLWANKEKIEAGV